MIEIVDYQPRWAAEFLEISRKLRNGIGTIALRIDHIGSTAIRGLAAKDVLDIQVSVTAFDDHLLERLTALGYLRVESINSDHRPPNDDSLASEWQKWVFRQPLGQRRTNTHVRILGRANQRYSLLFRDYLRTHPATTAAYANLKRQLARELKDDTLYPTVKDPAVDLIYLAAVDWAATMGWQVGPSDA